MPRGSWRLGNRALQLEKVRGKEFRLFWGLVDFAKPNGVVVRKTALGKKGENLT